MHIAIGLPIASLEPTKNWADDAPGGLIVWLDANDQATLFQDTALTTPVTAADQTVKGWQNKGSLGVNAISNAGPVYKTNVQNGLPGLEFTTAQYLDIAGAYAGLGVTLIAAFIPTSTTGTKGVISHWHDVNGGTQLVVISGQVAIRVGTPDASKGVGITNGAAVIAAATSTSNALHIRKNNNGRQANSHDSSSAATLYSIGRNSVRLTGNAFVGRMLECLIYSPGLSATDELLAVAYLNTKWAIF